MSLHAAVHRPAGRTRAPHLALALALALALVLATLGGCARPAGRATGDTDTAAAGDTTGSLFELTFPLTDQAGRTRHLAEFRGEPFIASMIYTNCTSVCPRVTADLQRLEAALPPATRAQMRFVLFSLDPARDTPAALDSFATAHHLDRARWTLLAAGPDDMRTLAAVLGVRFRPDEGGEIAHSAVVAVVDGEGVIRHRQVGIKEEPTELVAAVAEVSAWR